MGYLNTGMNKVKYQEILNSKVMVDKSMLIEKVNEFISTSGKYINMTRPRRFGKTVNANMLAAYYNCKVDSYDMFKNLNISNSPSYDKHINQHNVIYIDFTDVYDNTNNYQEFVNKLKRNLSRDISEAYQKAKFYDDMSLSEMFYETQDRFIFIFDEWDCVFNNSYFTNNDKKAYLLLLKGLLKDKAYVELCYMTGVLPIAKYSSGSELNMFQQYSFMEDEIFSEFFGFTELEVKELCLKHEMNFEEISEWYNGYYDSFGHRLYNPRSVSEALTRKKCKSYWTNTGPMDEISYMIQNNVDEVREDVISMVTGTPIDIVFKRQFAAETLSLNTRDEILSAMVIYGFLSYYDNYLSIPNKELMLKFDAVLYEEQMGDYAILSNNSKKLLKETLSCNKEYVAQMLEEYHDMEIPLLTYNDENSLACLIQIAYLAARDKYKIIREEKSGKGYADFIFTPFRKHEPAIILELKVNKSTQEALQQIKEKNYLQKVKDYDVVIVGINYDSKNKKHEVEFEKVPKS